MAHLGGWPYMKNIKFVKLLYRRYALVWTIKCAADNKLHSEFQKFIFEENLKPKNIHNTDENG